MPLETVMLVRFGRVLSEEDKKDIKQELKFQLRKRSKWNSTSIRFVKKFKRKTK